MPDKRVINWIHRVQSADAQAIELLREANKQASQVLTDRARPDTFWAARPMSRSGKVRTDRPTPRLNRVTGFSLLGFSSI